MGMGEPMLNLDAVLEAARALPDVGITWRRSTISTVGWLPGLRRFVDEVEEPIRLALSLHAPTDELRSELMPVNDRYPLGDVLGDAPPRRLVDPTEQLGPGQDGGPVLEVHVGRRSYAAPAPPGRAGGPGTSARRQPGCRGLDCPAVPPRPRLLASAGRPRRRRE